LFVGCAINIFCVGIINYLAINVFFFMKFLVFIVG
jgi:hypothetical protein